MTANQVLSGLRFDGEQGAITYRGVRYMLIRPETVMGVFRAMEEEFPGGAGEFFFKGGFTGGRLSAQRFRDEFGLVGVQVVEFMMEMGTKIGWGRFQLEKYDGEGMLIEVRVVGSPYAEAHGPSERPVCHLIRGVVAGVTQGIFGVPVTCREVACFATGAEACLFRASATGSTV